jgi:hypothetical protein
MPDNFDGSEEKVAQLKQNIARSGIVGSLLATNFKSAMVFVPLMDTDSATGKRLDYSAFSKQIENNIRKKYEAAGKGKDQDPRRRLRQTGGGPDRRPDAGDDLFRAGALIAAIVIFLYTAVRAPCW